jgi:hypothetical protein
MVYQMKKNPPIAANYIFHSNRIEGCRLSLIETRQILKGLKNNVSYTDMLVVQNHLSAVNLVTELAANSHELEESDIKHIHFVLANHLVSHPGGYTTMLL